MRKNQLVKKWERELKRYEGSTGECAIVKYNTIKGMLQDLYELKTDDV